MTDVELVDVEELVVVDVLELETDVEVVVEVEVRLLVDDELDDERVVLPVEFHRPPLSQMLCVLFERELLPVPMQKLVGELCLIFCREIGKKFGGNFAGLFSDPQNKGLEFSEYFQSVFNKRIRNSIRIFRANFVCRNATPKFLGLCARG